MYIAAGLFAFALLVGLTWLLFTIDDWGRDFTTNYAATSAAAKNPSLRPVDAGLSPRDAAKLVVSAAKQIPGWESASTEELGDEIVLRLVRTTKLMRFKDDITVHIRPASDGNIPAKCEISAESKSRIGKGDFGQNPRNLAELMDKVRSLLP
ncbi:MAG: DUF1499 domain-containing protein [Planctomycetales bacterium]|nr:DUF1499 domain-containing protein [Planctomycetales bacterium]